ncbi:hypothetical protein SAY86_023301 [Trapa natans]|uniref:Uncharacterized protein n=1 Tax=Trapa natans TaxID=22666 RepID=A0AAN7LU95_TRANT|nr:hypothetical protein SAY86_023301 [Trapa natans]
MSIHRVWQQRPAFFRPIQCSLHGDEHLIQTVANVVTSLPFIALGMQAPSAYWNGMMEAAFAKRALKDPDLRMVHNVHKMASLLGGVLFIADDVFPKNSYLHAAWHLAAAVGVGTCNKLLQ